jgi:hypothetical protein
MVTNELVNKILDGRLTTTTVGGEKFSLSDKAAIKWQYVPLGHFERALWSAIEAADGPNRGKLASGFPAEVMGYVNWTRGDLARRLRAAGVVFEGEQNDSNSE